MSTVIQVSEICIKKGLSSNLPDALNEAELAFTTDSGQVFVGAPNLPDLSWRRQGETYSQYPYGNIRLLTELDVGKMISGDVSLNVPLQTFNIPTTNGVSIDISTTATPNTVAVSPTNPMPMFYLPPSANTAKMDISIVDGTTNEIYLATLYIAAYTLTGSSDMTVSISSVGNIPSGLTFYGSTDNINRVVNTNAAANGYAETTYDTTESETTVTISDIQIKLGYVNTNAVTYTVYASMSCWESSSNSSAPTPGLSGVIAVSSAYSNANVIYPKGEKGDKGNDGNSYPNDGTTPVNASSVTSNSASFKNLTVSGKTILGDNNQVYSVFDLSATDSLSRNTISNISTNLATARASVSPGLRMNSFLTDGYMVFSAGICTGPIYFNNGSAGIYDGYDYMQLSMDVDVVSGGVTIGAGSYLMVENATGIQFKATSTTGTNFYQLAYNNAGQLELDSPTGGEFFTAGNVYFSGTTTIDNLVVKELQTSFIELESASMVKGTKLVNNMAQIYSTTSGSGGLIGWNLVNDDLSMWLVNMLGKNDTSGFKFVSYTTSSTIAKNDYDVMFDASGNITAKGGLTLGDGSTIVLSDSSGTGTITIGYSSTDQAVIVSETGIAVGAFVFPDNVTAKSLTTTASLGISDYSGNVPSTKWVKNYVESTKVNFSNDGTSDLFANNGSFSTLQVTGLTTLQNVTAITPVTDDNSNNVATTAFVNASVKNYLNSVALSEYMTTEVADATFVSGKYGMATTDYQVQGLYYSNEASLPVVVYTDSNGGINQINVIDSTFASSNFVSQTQLSTLFPNDGTSNGSFQILTAKTLTVTGVTQLNSASATTPSLTDTSNRIATCSFVSGQNYISGSYGVSGASTVYYGKGLYYSITTGAPTFVYVDSSSKVNSLPMVTQAYLNTNYVSKSSLTSTLSSYATVTSLSAYVDKNFLSQNYVPLTTAATFLTIPNAAATYATISSLDLYAKVADINNEYLTNDNFNSVISNYVTTSTLNNKQYVTASQLSSYALITSLSDYVTQEQFKQQNPTTPLQISDVQTYLAQNSYITSSALNGYLTSTVAASTYLTQTKFNTSMTKYFTSAQVTSNFISGVASSTSYDSVSSLYYDPTNDVITFNYANSTGTSGEFNSISKNYVDGKFVTKSTILPTSYAPWSAQVNFGGVAATIKINQSGYYIMGCICYIWLDATITAMGNGVGTMTITSLPTNATGTFPFPLNISISKTYTTVSATVSNTVINVYGSGTTSITNSNVYVGSEIIISGSYPIYLGS